MDELKNLKIKDNFKNKKNIERLDKISLVILRE